MDAGPTGDCHLSNHFTPAVSEWFSEKLGETLGKRIGKSAELLKKVEKRRVLSPAVAVLYL